MGRRFQAGQSGNPGGRQKGMELLVGLARAETEANIRALCRIRDSKKSPPAAVVAAVSVLFDRAFGKPKQEIDAGGSPVWVVRAPPEVQNVDAWLEAYRPPVQIEGKPLETKDDLPKADE